MYKLKNDTKIYQVSIKLKYFIWAAKKEIFYDQPSKNKLSYRILKQGLE